MKISMIYAKSQLSAIGKDNKLLWNLPKDMEHFKNTTKNHHIVMGRKTYESIGRPLPNRTNIVLTRDESFVADGCIVKHSIIDVIKYAKDNGEKELIVIGGSDIYNQFLPFASILYITDVFVIKGGDSYAPEIKLKEWKCIKAIEYPRDDKHEYAFHIKTLVKRKKKT